MTDTPIEAELIRYAKTQFRTMRRFGERHALGLVKSNIELWRSTYGESVANRVAGEMRKAVKDERKSDD